MKNNIKKLSKSIYLLLIFIKSESRISKELIEIVEIIYKGIIDKKEIRNVDIKDIVKKLKKSKEVYFSKPIIRELEKTIVFSIQKTKIIENQMLRIYEEVLGLILEKYKENEFKKIKTIASSTHNLPMFLINKENKKSYNYIWNVEIGFYERVWNEKILEKFKYIFIDEEKEKEKLRPYSLIKLTDEYKEWLKEQEKLDNPLLKEDTFIFLGEIPNMKEHCVIVGYKSGKIYSGYHLWNFQELNENEI